MSVRKRKPTSKKLRFEVFKRDGFACQYCGRTPPDVVLEVDHVIPVCGGGDHLAENMVTACFDCNRGKAGNPLEDVPASLQDRAERLEEAESQIKAYAKLLAAKKRRITQCVTRAEAIFKETFEGSAFTQRFKNDIRTAFAPHLMPDEIEDAMAYACSRMPDEDRATRYFCGICWNKIRKNQNG